MCGWLGSATPVCIIHLLPTLEGACNLSLFTYLQQNNHSTVLYMSKFSEGSIGNTKNNGASKARTQGEGNPIIVYIKHQHSLSLIHCNRHKRHTCLIEIDRFQSTLDPTIYKLSARHNKRSTILLSEAPGIAPRVTWIPYRKANFVVLAEEHSVRLSSSIRRRSERFAERAFLSLSTALAHMRLMLNVE